MTAAVAGVRSGAGRLLGLDDPGADLLKGNVRHKGHPEDDGNLQQHQLQLPNGDVVDAADAKLPVEALALEGVQVVDHIGPEVDDVVARKLVPLLHADHYDKQREMLEFLK